MVVRIRHDEREGLALETADRQSFRRFGRGDDRRIVGRRRNGIHFRLLREGRLLVKSDDLEPVGRFEGKALDGLGNRLTDFVRRGDDGGPADSLAGFIRRGTHDGVLVRSGEQIITGSRYLSRTGYGPGCGHGIGFGRRGKIRHLRRSQVFAIGERGHGVHHDADLLDIQDQGGTLGLQESFQEHFTRETRAAEVGNQQRRDTRGVRTRHRGSLV